MAIMKSTPQHALTVLALQNVNLLATTQHVARR